VDKVGRRKYTAFVLASHYNMSVCWTFLNHPNFDVNINGDFQLTPLHEAAEFCDVKKVKKLVQLGCMPNAVDSNGWTPVHWACSRV
jgi:ankyrin repeat protein